MLWTGYFLAFSMAGLLGLSLLRTAALCIITFVMVVAGNLLRALSLFTAEVRVPGELSEQMHSAAGLFCFALAGAAIVGAAFWLAQQQNPSHDAL